MSVSQMLPTVGPAACERCQQLQIVDPNGYCRNTGIHLHTARICNSLAFLATCEEWSKKHSSSGLHSVWVLLCCFLLGFGLLWSFRVLCNLSSNSFLTRLRPTECAWNFAHRALSHVVGNILAYVGHSSMVLRAPGKSSEKAFQNRFRGYLAVHCSACCCWLRATSHILQNGKSTTWRNMRSGQSPK